MPKSRTPLMIGWDAARANAKPALIIQAIMLGLAIAFYTNASVGDGLHNRLLGPPDVRLQPRTFVLNLKRVPPVADQNCSLGPNEQPARIAAEVGEVRHVDGVADGEQVEALVAHQAREPLSTAGEIVHAKHSSKGRMVGML